MFVWSRDAAFFDLFDSITKICRYTPSVVTKAKWQFGENQPVSPTLAQINARAYCCFLEGAGSVLQHLVAHGGRTSPQLFRAAMTSSTYLPPQYMYNDTIPEVRPIYWRHIKSVTKVWFRRFINKSSSKPGKFTCTNHENSRAHHHINTAAALTQRILSPA